MAIRPKANHVPSEYTAAIALPVHVGLADGRARAGEEHIAWSKLIRLPIVRGACWRDWLIVELALFRHVGDANIARQIGVELLRCDVGAVLAREGALAFQ